MKPYCLALSILILAATAAQLGLSQQAAVINVPGGVTRIDDIGIYDIGWKYRSGVGGSMPVGWTGHFDEATGISCTSFGVQAGKSLFLLHPPWRGGTGVTDQTLHLKLPAASAIHLNFAVAMKVGETGPGKSDGATFRVFVDGESLFDFNQTTAVWKQASLDLTRFAGKTIALRFETDPGPKDDPSFDYAFWGDRELEVDGVRANAVTRLHVAPLDVAIDRDYKPSKTIAPAANSLLSGRGLGVTTNEVFGSGIFGSLYLTVSRNLNLPPNSSDIGLGYGSYIDIVMDNGTIVRSDSSRVSGVVAGAGALSLLGGERTITYTCGKRSVRINVAFPHLSDSSLRADITSDDPYIAAIHFGSIGPVAFRRQIQVPYYGAVQYLPDSGLFANVIVDHQASRASRLEGASAYYEPLTDGTRHKLHETVYFALAPDLLSVLPVPNNLPSPFRSLLANKVVLDVWGGNYADNAAFLKELATYRITNLLTVAHVWQHGGYDNMLPDVLPAYAPLGGDEGMKEWTHTATGLGELISLHENYVDFYPNAPSWNETDVARDSNGHRVNAWLNEGTGVQSFAVAPDAILKYARRITPEVHKAFEPNASYLDVHSAVPPWFHVDFRPDRTGAGVYQTVWNAHKDLWQLFRTVHHGPVLGEGANHWYWSGLLDGVEAQFGVGVPGNSGMSAPLFVDFDLANIHPLQFNHGMGYLERWLPADFDQTWHTRIPSMKTLDQYRMQEVAYGHAGFIASPFQHSLPFIWQEHHLMSPLTERYATAPVRQIQYEVDGKLEPTNEAIAEGTAFDRVRITYANGLTVWANGRAADWQVASARLAQFGWCAQMPGFHADTSLRQAANGLSVVSDMVETPTSLFVNARSDYVGPERPHNITPSTSRFKQTGARRFTLQYSWKTAEKIASGYVVYIHVTGASGTGGEKIVFQPASGIAAHPSDWPETGMTTGVPIETTLPESMPDGKYEIRTGIYSPASGDRLRMMGQEDATGRILLGTLQVADGGAKISFTPPGVVQKSALDSEREQHVNLTRSMVDFGKVITNGSLLLEKRTHGVWTLTPFPRNTEIGVSLDGKNLDPKLTSISVEAFDAANKSHGIVKAALTSSRYRMTLNAKDGITHYELRRDR